MGTKSKAKNAAGKHADAVDGNHVMVCVLPTITVSARKFLTDMVAMNLLADDAAGLPGVKRVCDRIGLQMLGFDIEMKDRSGLTVGLGPIRAAMCLEAEKSLAYLIDEALAAIDGKGEHLDGFIVELAMALDHFAKGGKKAVMAAQSIEKLVRFFATRPVHGRTFKFEAMGAIAAGEIEARVLAELANEQREALAGAASPGCGKQSHSRSL